MERPSGVMQLFRDQREYIVIDGFEAVKLLFVCIEG